MYSKWLEKYFHHLGKCTKYIHIHSFTETLLGKIVLILRLPSNSSNGLLKGPKLLRLALRVLYILIDAWLTYFFIRITYAKHVVVCDRFFYDTLAYIACESPSFTLILMLAKLMPSPDITILLIASPEILLKRKQEYSYTYMKRLCFGYKKLSSIVNAAVISTEADVECVKGRILEVIRQHAM